MAIVVRRPSRSMSSQPPISRPAPPPLPATQQREFEELVRSAEASPSAHPDTPTPLKADFEGDVNPVTGERGGPKREPVGRWTEEGDWSFKGRVSDF
ncbi:hypothetical protein FA95DRAFT_1558756 [Auriscalpium vulgare]|uniref:Uncharacterized protein n=1 Tax=Auriscalpium vulgare TaxID=40419 RepID=A0ACB8RU73_9AGAM|nr:hypothetical protein FA95DRAFT_1558756 [Auriscalpium vulgare]